MAIATYPPAQAVPGASPGAQAHVVLCVRCAHCHGTADLECEGLQGFWGYLTYNEGLLSTLPQAESRADAGCRRLRSRRH